MIIRRDFARTGGNALNSEELGLWLAYAVMSLLTFVGLIYCSAAVTNLYGDLVGGFYLMNTACAAYSGAGAIFRHQRQLGREECQ